tara:strand:- start:1260 stop:1463 length:204 start_codon:yes stop_codon:yes gene_type:complete
MKSLKDRILSAKTKKELDSLSEEFSKYTSVSTNTKTKIKKAVKRRIDELDGAVKTKKIKKTKKTKGE